MDHLSKKKVIRGKLWQAFSEAFGVFNFLLFVFLCTSTFVRGDFVLLEKINGQDVTKTIDASHFDLEYVTIQDVPKKVEIKVNQDLSLTGLYYDRGSDNVIIIGQGFPGGKECGFEYGQLFADYDILLFDYRWRNIFPYLLNDLRFFHPYKNLLQIGDEDVKAVVNFVRQKKEYRQVVGLGVCYSCFTFLKAQSIAESENNKLFDKLILDSCWYSIEAFLPQIVKDPYLPVSPQYGGAPNWLKRILGCKLITNSLLFVTGMFAADINVTEYLGSVSIAKLFFHGKEDLMVPLELFKKKIFSLASAGEKNYAIMTPYEHADNIQNKAMYYSLCNDFITNCCIRSH